VSELIPVDGKRWGFVTAVLAALPRAARVSAGRIRDWVRRGLLEARHSGRRLVVAIEDVLRVERETRQTTKARGGPKRGSKAKSALA
jgi:hypothetical protein